MLQVAHKPLSHSHNQEAKIALFHQHGTGSVPVRAPNFEPFGAFRPKINWFGTRKVGSQLEPKNGRFSLRTVMTSVGVSFSRFKVHCATPSVDDASFITMVPLKTGGNAGWFARWHQGSKNPERNRFKNQSLFGGKGLKEDEPADPHLYL